MLEFALRYIARGWRVFPLHSTSGDGSCTCGKSACTDIGKHPRAELAPRGVKDATIDEEKIRAWFGPGAPLSNIAIATGEKSGITVLDIDIGAKGGDKTWQVLIADHGEPVTLVAETGSGGMHWLFQYYSGLKTSSATLGPGIDVRNNNGYIVAAPSRHRTGGIYKWLDAIDTPLAYLPEYLTRKVETRGRKAKDDPSRRKYTIAQVAAMLEHIQADDRDLWIHIGIILGREFNRAVEAWEIYVAWSNKWGGTKTRNHDEIMAQAFNETSQKSTTGELTIGTIIKKAVEGGWAPVVGEVPIDSFLFFGPGNNFIYRPTVSHWIAEAVNAACSPINENGYIRRAADWLREHALVSSMTNDPEIEVDYYKNFDCRDGVLIQSIGAAVFNTYKEPSVEQGDARLASPFIEHVKRVFPKSGDADQFLDYMAHRVQRPGEKPRFALLIAGDQGVGKDTAVEFCCPAIGHWNVGNIEPNDLDTAFNEYAASVLVRVSEAANLHDMNKWAFNERMKVLIAGTPDHVSINPKYGQKYSVRLHCGVIITTNHMISGIYIPADDRRYDVIEAATKAEMELDNDEKSKEYFGELWDWFNEDGKNHVAAFLYERNISKFSASNGQRKTEAHKVVVNSNLSTDHWIYDALNELHEPELVRSDAVMSAALKDGLFTMKEVSSRMQAAMLRAGYNPVRCVARKDGRWRIEGKLATVYARRGLVGSAQEVAARIDGLRDPF